jgi:hypothetical protein
METDDSIKNEPKDSSQLSTASSTPLPVSSSNTPVASNLAAAATNTTTTTTKTKLPSIVLPEVDLYLNLLVLLFSIDRQKYKQVSFCSFIYFVMN